MKKKKRTARPLLIASVGLTAIMLGGVGCGGDNNTGLGVSDMHVAGNDMGTSILDLDGGTDVDGSTH